MVFIWGSNEGCAKRSRDGNDVYYKAKKRSSNIKPKMQTSSNFNDGAAFGTVRFDGPITKSG